MGLDGIHPKVLAEVLSELLPIIYRQCWITGEVPVDWRLANVTHIYREGRKDDPGNYRPVTLPSVPGEVMEQIILSAIMQHIQDNQLWALQPPVPRRGFAATLIRKSYDVRRVEITPLEQRKVTFDTHALVKDLEAHGFGKEQAETIVSALITLSNVSLDTVYKDMVTQAQQEITLQQIMAHLDSIRKDMVILEKSEFANLRAENEKMKIELDQIKQQLVNETGKIRADSKLDINLERSRVTDMFTDQERKLMEASTEFHKKDSSTNSVISEISNKIDTEIASLKTLMESNKLDTIRYLAASVFTCLAIALGFYRFWK
ncbi:coiled-coil domain-containing protein 90B, mitochondrial [Athene cunicularia]|uniref:coiled-coil domain-containing protein 90B, mitochondrial n=1 Tax=Athene cunicularia TaxID=194338 RepID=UPI000EF6EDF6|nr:coiled-coil domain-containing protein 90B, mitochondrial [Athene cunicularia]